jgi:hypothetical protein
MDKLKLKKIAKRWCKGVLEHSEGMVSFYECGLTHEEVDYIQSEIQKIAERITNDDSVPDTAKLVDEYFE